MKLILEIPLKNKHFFCPSGYTHSFTVGNWDKYKFVKILTFCVLYLISLWLILRPKKISSRYILLLWVLVYSLYIYAMHVTVFSPGSDLEKYAGLFQSQTLFLDLRYLREMFFFGSASLIYQISQSTTTTFVVLDVIFGALLLKSFELRQRSMPSVRHSHSAYLLFAYLLFFPIVIGYENTYRQVLSVILFFLALGFISNNRKYIGSLIFLCSFLTHNVAGLFLPVILISYKKRMYNILAFIGIICMPIVIYMSQIGDNELLNREFVNYGATLSVTFLVVFSVILFLAMYLNIKSIDRESFYSIAAISIIYLLVFVMVESNLHRERVALFGFALIYFPLSKLVDHVANKVFYRLMFFHLALTPILVFYNAWLFA